MSGWLRPLPPEHRREADRQRTERQKREAQQRRNPKRKERP